MTSANHLAGGVIDVFSDHLSVPKKTVRQVRAVLIGDNRIEHGSPISPAMTPRSIARILLALASPAIKDAAKYGQALGALPLSVGDGQPTLETELTDMIEEAAGWRNGNSNFRDDRVILTPTFAQVGASTFRAGKSDKGMHRFIAIDTSAIAQIARALLPAVRV